MFERFAKSPRLPLPAAALAGTLLIGAASGCAYKTDVLLSSDTLKKATISDGFIYNHYSVRTDPARIEDPGDGSDNACMKDINAAIVFNAQTVYESNGIGDDANGPWIGFDINHLPKDALSSQCLNDKDGVVWVAQSGVVGALR